MPTTARHDANESARTVSELTREIKDQLENHYPDVWVTGEISNCRPARSGHVYLTLKDDQSQISAVIWRNTACHSRRESSCPQAQVGSSW